MKFFSRSVKMHHDQPTIAVFPALFDENGIEVFTEVQLQLAGTARNQRGNVVVFTTNGFTITVQEA